MSGTLAFYQSDLYGPYPGTTDLTQPNPVTAVSAEDNQTVAENMSTTGQKKGGILTALLLLFLIALIFGGLKR